MAKCFKKVFIFVIVMAMVAGMASSAFAMLDASEYIHSKSADVTAQGGGKVKITFTITGTDIMKKIGASSITVYGSDGSSKTYTYTATGYENMMGESAALYSSSITHKGTAGVSYYAIVTFYAEASGGGNDSVPYITSSVTA